MFATFLPRIFIVLFAIEELKIETYTTITLPFVLYGCETWSIILREKRRFRVFENRVLRKIFGSKMEEVREYWRRLHNEELYDLYSSPYIIRLINLRRMTWAGHVARMGERRGAYRVLVGNFMERTPWKT
jgi:hypothetical protein